ncbi:MAG: sodium:proton antiporter [Clostridia bacterium]|nr:sodium:proton antiporter [Clostridia bacterium]
MTLAFLVFFPMIAAVLSYLIGKHSKGARDNFVILACLVILGVCAAALLGVVNGVTYTLNIPGFCGFGLNFELDGFRALYALIGGVMWLCTSMLSKQYFAHHYHNRNRYYFFFLMTLGATLGVFLSSDLYTTFIFFEIMSFTSYTWVCHDENAGAMRAAETYLAVAIIGGMVMLVGLFILYLTLGTLTISELHHAAEACTEQGKLWIACICILFGFGAKAGMFPMHIWLPKAHPVAPAPASALLSGILTKTGVFGIIVVSANIFRESKAWGNMLLVLALITMLGGAVLAVFSVNLKRTLACSSMSQIGFILTGISMSCLLGHHNALAARGALLYMLNHSLFKLILFMAAGVVYMHLHKLNLNDVRGFGRRKPILHFAFLMGAFGLMGVPGFSGYVSKTLIHESIVEYVHLLTQDGLTGLSVLYTIAEWIYLFSGGLTGAYMIKLYICLFWQKHPSEQIFYNANKKYMTALTRIALFAAAILVPVLGVQPNLTMDVIADFAGGFLHAGTPEHHVEYFSWVNLKGACISLIIGLLVYLFFIRTTLMPKENGVRVYVDLWPEKLDIEDRIYRPAIYGLLNFGGKLAQIGNEQKLEEHVYWPAVRGLVRVGHGAAKLASEDTLENRIYWPALRGLSFAGAVISKAMGDILDEIALIFTNTFLKMKHYTEKIRVGNPLTDTVGGAADKFAELLNHTVFKGHPHAHHYTGKLAGWWNGMMAAMRKMTHTMSYGLLLFGIGMCVTFIYLLLY